MEKDEKAKIESLLKEYRLALNTSNADKAVELYAKDGVFMPSEAPSAIGTPNIKNSYDFIFTQICLNIEFFIEEIVIEGKFAFATTISKGTVTIRALEKTLPEENRELFIFKNIDGEWKIGRYMFNKMTPAVQQTQ